MHPLKKLIKYPDFYSKKINIVNKRDKNISYTELLSKLDFPNRRLRFRDVAKILKNPAKKPQPKKITKRHLFQNVLPFFNDPIVSETDNTKDYYEETYKVEISDKTDLDVSLYAATDSITDLFRYILRRQKGFKYNLEIEATLKRCNYITNNYDYHVFHAKVSAITVTNWNFYLNKPFEVLKRKLDNYNAEGSGWIFESLDKINIYISKFEPLAGSSYIELPKELQNSMKGLID